MSVTVAEGIIELKVDDSGVTSGVKAQEGKITSAGQDAGKKFGGGFSGAAKGLIGAAVAAGAVTAGVKFVSSALAEAGEAEKVGRQTEATIKATGGAANLTTKEVENLAGALSAKTAIDDEVIQSGENMLLTFKNVRDEAGKNNDVFSQATGAALDLSAAGFGSVESASVMLGKALNDPTKGISALSRVGVGFTEQQKKQVEALQKSGDMLGAQKIILGEVKGQVGGVAEATASSGDKMRVAWGNVLETVGTLLLPLFETFADFFTTTLAPAITTGVENVGSLVAVVMEVVGFIREWSLVIGLVVAALLLLNANLILNTAAIVAYNVVTKIVTAATRAWSVVQFILNAALLANPIVLIVAGILLLIAAIIVAYKKSATFRTIVQAAFGAIRKAVEAVVNFFKGPFRTFFTSTLPNFFKQAWEKAKSITVTVLSAIFNFVKSAPGKIFGFLASLTGRLREIFANAFQAARSAVTNGISNIIGFIRSLPGRIAALAGTFLNAGKNLGGKIISGIMDGLRAAGGFVSDIGSAVKSAINSALNLPFTIHGPGPLPDFTIPAFAEGGLVRMQIL
jgi:hypothetical protein